MSMVANLEKRYNGIMPDELIWEAEEYFHSEKHPDWFWVVGAVATVGVLLSIWRLNFLLAIIILLGTITLMIYANRPPERIRFTLSSRGLKAKEEFFPFKKLKSFWVQRDRQAPKIMIKSDRFFLPYIVFPLAEIEPDDVRQYLLRFLPEEEHEESLIEVVAERLGF